MNDITSDVAVIGGGPAGFAAALAARHAGASVALIERCPFFGGNATAASVAAFCGFHTRGENPDLAVRGVGAELLQLMEQRGYRLETCVSPSSGNTTTKFDPEELKLALDEMLASSGVVGITHASFVDCSVEDGVVSSLLCCDDQGPFRVFAKQFVDATGNASLVERAGGATCWGDENGVVQQASLVFRIEGLPDRVISPAELKDAVVRGKAAGIEWLDKESGVIIKMDGDSYGYCTIPSTDISDLSASELGAAEVRLRRQVRSYMEAFRRYIPDFSHAHVSASGPSMGLRESRRVKGRQTLEGEDILAGVKRDDSIARAAWSPEIHRSDADPRYIHIPDNDYASIPFGTLEVPSVTNVWAAGRAISADPLAFASVRVMGTAMATGQAAGVAAALSLGGSGVTARDVQKVLDAQDALY